MLLKLIKFKLRSAKKGLLLVSVGMVAFAAIFALSVNLMFLLTQEGTESTLKDIALIFVMPMMGVSILGFIFAIFAGYALTAYSAYQTYGKSSAYLYFTLPASRSSIYAASVITIVIKLLLLSLLAILSISFVFVTFTLNAAIQSFVNDFSELFADLFSMYKSLLGGGKTNAGEIILNVFLYLLYSVVSLIYSAVYFNFACIFGCSLAKKHKLLGCILTGIITNYLISFAHSIMVGLPTLLLHNDELSVLSILSILFETIFYAAATVLLHMISIKRLNKEFDITI